MPKLKNKWTGEEKNFGYDIMGEQEAQQFLDTGVWEAVEDGSQSIFETEEIKKKKEASVVGEYKPLDFKSEFNKEFGIKSLKKLSGFDKLQIEPLGFNPDDGEDEDDNFGW